MFLGIHSKTTYKNVCVLCSYSAGEKVNRNVIFPYLSERELFISF